MPIRIEQTHFVGPLAERLATMPRDSTVVVHWLGQAGFVITAGAVRLMIDPYLSDSLADKYRGTATSHERLMPAPIAVEDLGPIDLVLSTHHHTDHMDPATLGPLAMAQPALRFVVPAASVEEARRRIGVGSERLIGVDAGAVIAPIPDLCITVLRAAHEALERDAAGHHRFLGYALRFGQPNGVGITLVHSGDTIPFDGQVEELTRLGPDLLLLPVNGRSDSLRAKGIAGNLTLEEAVALTAAAGAPAMVAHHHGMFAFNTRPVAEIEALAATPELPIRLIPARPQMELHLSK